MQRRVPILPLIAAKSVVEVLAGRRLSPLRIRRLLAPTITAGARGSGITHRLRVIGGGRLSLRTRVVALLSIILTYNACQSKVFAREM